MLPGLTDWAPLIDTPGMTARISTRLFGLEAPDLDSRFEFIDASLSCDRSRPRRWQLQSARFFTSTSPRQTGHPLNIVTGCTFQLELGHSGLWAPAGRYTLRTVDCDTGEGGWIVDAALEDVSYLVSRDRPLKGLNLPEAGTALTVAAIIAGRGGTAGLINQSSSTATTAPLYLDADVDLWAEAQRVAVEAGLDLGMDPEGRPVLRDAPTSTTEPVWRFPADQEPIRVGWSQDADDIANGVIVRLEAPWQKFAVQGSAFDSNENSPTFVDGPFGRRPIVVTSSSVANTAAAEALAARHLARAQNAGQVGVVCSPMPLLEAGDVVQVVDFDLGVDVAMVVDSWRLPSLHAQPQTLQLRQVEVV